MICTRLSFALAPQDSVISADWKLQRTVGCGDRWTWLAKIQQQWTACCSISTRMTIVFRT